MRRIEIAAGDKKARAVLNESKTADAVWAALPVEAKANTWGDEIYFSIPVALDEDEAEEVVDAGDLGYWPVGNAFCIFWGPTPASRTGEIRAASPVNLFGRLERDPRVFDDLDSGETIRVSQVSGTDNKGM